MPQEANQKNKITKPLICCIDAKQDVADKLEDEGYNIYKGTLGACVNIPNAHRGNSEYVFLDFEFPENFHEYDILILDLTNEQKKPFERQSLADHKTRHNSYLTIECSYPKTVFDPRPISSSLLGGKIREIQGRKFIQIIFSAANYSIEYDIVEVSDYIKESGKEKHDLYRFYNSGLIAQPRTGKEVVICPSRDDLKQILTKYQDELKYHQTFFHPTEWSNEEGKSVPSRKAIPLIKNVNDEIVSLLYVEEKLVTFYFPDIKNKASFLSELLKNVLPAVYPQIFPFTTQFKWLENEEYFIPNHQDLLNEKELNKEKFLEQNRLVDEKIIENNKKYQFLHELITETGDRLVHSVFAFLKWLEFKKVVIKDEQSQNVKEEDLQVELDNGLLVIETKGIGGTSTDSDCSQISKIKNRRGKERNAYDVFGLYIVNHQRYLPPLHRKNPPFTEEQINDAVNDERGLLTTWQLFNLYHEIQKGIITKEQARKQLLQFGYIAFKPLLGKSLGLPKEVLKEGHVVIIDLTKTKLKIGDEIIIEKKENYLKAKILSIQVDGKLTDEAEDGEIGIKLDTKVNKNSTLWTL